MIILEVSITNFSLQRGGGKSSRDDTLADSLCPWNRVLYIVYCIIVYSFQIWASKVDNPHLRRCADADVRIEIRVHL